MWDNQAGKISVHLVFNLRLLIPSRSGPDLDSTLNIRGSIYAKAET